MSLEDLKVIYGQWSEYLHTGIYPEENPYYELLEKYDHICEGTGIPAKGQMELDFLRALAEKAYRAEK
jgi:hypothetical protein